MRAASQRTILLALSLVLIGACASGRTTTPETAAAVAAPTAYGDWSFTMSIGGGAQRMDGAMTISPEAGQSRMTIRDFNVVNETVQNSTVEMQPDGAFLWSGSVGGTTFSMTGRVQGEQLQAAGSADAVGQFEITGQRAPAGP